MDLKTRAKVAQTQAQIEKALAELEKETGQIVENIEICLIEVSSCSDSVPVFKASVQIRMQPIPTRRWE